ncbi:MAG: flagellar basal-body MS-ring/collar protein FliF [bacterium]|nr:flagellar basal-body MS-ring/collar protein FliF [bacterium]
MDAIKDFIERMRETFDGLDRNKKIGVGAGIGVLIIALIFLFSGGGETDENYLPLYIELDMKEVGELTNRLLEMNQPFKLGGDGTLVMVPEDARLRLRAALAAEGFPATGLIGYEVFDEVPLGITDFLQKIKMRQALEGELKKTIMQLEQVEDVRVAVVTPEPSLFTDQQKPATASIMLTLRPRMSLKKEQVQAVQRLVASSVEGLDPKNITVIDNSGNLLSEEVDPLASLTSKQLEVQRNIEKYMESRVQSTMDNVLGPDQARINVSVELDFDQKQIELESFDPDNTVLRSEERNEEQSAEAGTSERSIANYEINRRIEHISGAPGTMKRISAALMINDRVPDPANSTDDAPAYRTRTPAEIIYIEDIARGALGIDPNRGDQLTTSTFVFAIQDIRFQQEKKQRAEEQSELITEIILNVAKGLAIVIALLVLRAIIGAIGRGVAREEEIAMEAQRELEDDDAIEELPETPHEIILGRIAQLITERPEDAARLIRTMLIEDSQARQRQGA